MVRETEDGGNYGRAGKVVLGAASLGVWRARYGLPLGDVRLHVQQQLLGVLDHEGHHGGEQQVVRLGGGTELVDRAESRESRGSSLTCSASGLSFLGQSMCVEKRVPRLVEFILFSASLAATACTNSGSPELFSGLVNNSQCAVDIYHFTVHNSHYAVTHILEEPPADYHLSGIRCQGLHRLGPLSFKTS